MRTMQQHMERTAQGAADSDSLLTGVPLLEGRLTPAIQLHLKTTPTCGCLLVCSGGSLLRLLAWCTGLTSSQQMQLLDAATQACTAEAEKRTLQGTGQWGVQVEREGASLLAVSEPATCLLLVLTSVLTAVRRCPSVSLLMQSLSSHWQLCSLQRTVLIKTHLRMCYDRGCSGCSSCWTAQALPPRLTALRRRCSYSAAWSRASAASPGTLP